MSPRLSKRAVAQDQSQATARIQQAPDAAAHPAWVRNGKLAQYFTVSAMCIWRWKRDPTLACPPSYIVNGIEYNDLDAWNRWMRDRMISHIGRSRKSKKEQRHV